MKILHCHANHHLGDIMFTFIVLYNIKEYLENNDTTVFFYTRTEHIEQMKDFKPIKEMQFFDFSQKPENSIEIWNCDDYFFEPDRKKHNHSKHFSGMSQNSYYVKYFNIRLNEVFKIPLSLKEFSYIDEELVTRFEKLPDVYKNKDILIINSDPMSNQFSYNPNNWKHAINLLNSKYKIVTTKKIDDSVLCTRDFNLKIKDIAALSTNIKVVIAINTGPLAALFNKYTLENVKKFYIFDNRTYFDYPKFENKNFLRDIPLEELDKYTA